MQTFLPYPSFTASALTLDSRRLGKQRVEAMQIIRALDVGGGWANHPATKMWRGCRLALMLYHDVCIREWVRRGYTNNMHTLVFRSPESEVPPHIETIPMPEWLGREDVHSSHRANLLRKDPEHYGQFGWTEQPQEGYVWPSVS